MISSYILVPYIPVIPKLQFLFKHRIQIPVFFFIIFCHFGGNRGSWSPRINDILLFSSMATNLGIDLLPLVRNLFISSSCSSLKIIFKSIKSDRLAILLITGSTCAASPHHPSVKTNQVTDFFLGLLCMNWFFQIVEWFYQGASFFCNSAYYSSIKHLIVSGL